MANLSLYKAHDVLPFGFSGSPWADVFAILAELFKKVFSVDDDGNGGFVHHASVYSALLAGDFERITDRRALDAFAAAIGIPAWVADAGRPDIGTYPQAVLAAWLRYRGTTSDFVSLIVSSGAASVSFEHDDAGKVTCLIGGIRGSIFYSDFDEEPVDRFFDRVRAFLPIAFGSRVTLSEEICGFMYDASSDTLTPAVYDDDAETVDVDLD